MENKTTYTKLSMLLHFLKGSKRYFFISILSAFLLTGVEMIIPQVISITVDAVLGNDASSLSAVALWALDFFGGAEYIKNALYLPALIIAALAVFNAVGKYLNMYYNVKASECLMYKMRVSLFDHIQHLPYHWHMKHQTGDIIQRATSDVETIRHFVSDQLTSVFRIVILVTLSLIFMFRMHAGLALVATIFVPIILAYSLVYHMKIGSHFEKCDESEGKLSTIAQENLTGVRVVRAFGRENFEKSRFEAQNQDYTNGWIKLMKIMNLFWVSGDLLSGLQIMTIMIIGAVLGAKGVLSVGVFIAFVSYNYMLIWPVRQFGRVVSEMSKAGVALDRIRAIMNDPIEENPKDAQMPDMKGDIVFSGVSYAYDGVTDVLTDVSMTIPKGSVFGILGPTGAGKSTLVHMLDRLICPDKGTITISGVDIQIIDLSWLREHIGFVLQEPFLFSKTIGENIAITQDEYHIDAIRDVSSAACLDDTVSNFTQGYDTIVGERGVTLSGGQKQRTAIARMLMQKTPIMVLDDSLSAVDAQTDANIRKELDKRFKDATVILISHRVATLMQADQIMVLDKGKVAELGSHADLYEKGGIYRKIYDLQTQGLFEIATEEGEGTK